MDHTMIEQSSSCETASYSDQPLSCYVALDIYFTPILRDPSLMKAETNISRKSFRLVENCFILCQKDGVKIQVANTKRKAARLLVDGFELIAEVKLQKQQNGKYDFTLQRSFGTNESDNSFKKVSGQNQKNSVDSAVFYSLKSGINHSENQEIQHNDFIKFGKEVYQAKIFSHSEQKKLIKMADMSPIQQITNFQVKNKIGECKICLMGEGQYEKDYVVSPCKCSGTCSLVHVECLKKWISLKIEVGKEEKKLHTYDISRFSCEICKQKYPQMLQIDESLVDISPQIGITDDTLILSKVFPTEDSKKISHMVSLSRGGSLSVGRHYYNELILDDLSISRNHALIHRSRNDKFYLNDKNSRFGTFINLKNPIYNLNEAILITSKQTFRFKLFEESVKASSPQRCDEEQVTEEIIEY